MSTYYDQGYDLVDPYIPCQEVNAQVGRENLAFSINYLGVNPIVRVYHRDGNYTFAEVHLDREGVLLFIFPEGKWELPLKSVGGPDARHKMYELVRYNYTPVQRFIFGVTAAAITKTIR